MSKTPPELLDQATIDLIFALRDSLTEASPNRIDFWNGRAASAIATAAAGSQSAGQAITTAARKLQIDTLATSTAPTIKKVAEIIDENFDDWAAHIDRNIVYIVALAAVENKTRKAKRTKTTPQEPVQIKQADKEIPF